ncbi:DUF86 domain-containing protein [bacterium]|nr:DUF86 domain-containing protein [bacterium]
MKREVIDYIIDIKKECEYLLSRSKEISYDEFIKNEDFKKAFVRSLEIIGEAVKKIPEEIKNCYPQIKWKNISGMRDILIHEYFGVDYKVVWKTVIERIPELKDVIEKMIKNFTDIQE